MFTGIIRHIGTVAAIKKTGDWYFRIAVAEDFMRGVALGASIACSGCCLTVTAKEKKGFTVQVSRETLARTVLRTWKKGTRINLERALKVGDELGGHFVSGHVDGLAKIEKIETSAQSKVIIFSCKKKLLRFIALKGSVTLDGVSLTVNKAKGSHFTVNVIPHTLKHTTLGERKKGDRLNLEIDLIARYLARLKEV